jgi:hypothetical protein
MPDFYEDYPFKEVVLKIGDPAEFCSVGDIVMGMELGAQGRVERFVDGGVLVHPIKQISFRRGETLVSPTGVSEVLEVMAA